MMWRGTSIPERMAASTFPPIAYVYWPNGVFARINAKMPSNMMTTTTEDGKRIKELEREVRELKRANEILLAASSFFARELDPRLPW